MSEFKPKYVAPFLTRDTQEVAKGLFKFLETRDKSKADLEKNCKLLSISYYWVPAVQFSYELRVSWSASIGYDREVERYRNGQREKETITDWVPDHGVFETDISSQALLSNIDSDELKNALNHRNELVVFDEDSDGVIPILPIFADDDINSAIWDKVDDYMDDEVRSRMVGDRSKDRVWDLKILSTDYEDFLLLPLVVCRVNYKGKEYQVRMDGTTFKRGDDNLPLMSNLQWIVLGIAALFVLIMISAG